ncbi:MAG: Hpt domain-containing protein [Bryobacterales bacterium]|nr:Hpt domain-containing protein [Bryobacterales bacterium]
MAEIYLAEYPPLLDKIRSAVSSKDCDALQRSAHTLKGSLAILGAEPAAALALSLETQGRQNHLDSADEILSHLEEELIRVHHEMHALAEGS